MNNFTFCSPTKFVFGRGVTDQVGAELAGAGHRRALIVYGQGSVVRTGTLDRVKASLDAAGVSHVELGGVRPNPEVELVREGAELAEREGVDIVLPVGGGSAMDCAKGIALCAGYEGDAWDFWAKKATAERCLPVATVVTIPASGSEASNSCVISNDALGLKCGCNSELIRPKIAFLDPELTFTLPPYQTAAGVTDMIAHVMERFFSGEPAVGVTDNIACGLVRAVIDASRIVMEDPQDYDARAELMWIGTLAHNGLAGCGLGIPGMRDGIGPATAWSMRCSMTKIPTAPALPSSSRRGCAMCGRAIPIASSPSVPRSSASSLSNPAWTTCPASMRRSPPNAPCMTPIEATIDELQDFFMSMGMPSTLSELGIAEDDIDQMICGLRATRGERFGTFRSLSLDDARAIYESAL